MALNDGYEYRETIGPVAAGRALLDHLAEGYPHSPRDVWRERIASGEVRVDRAGASPGAPLRCGQIVSWRRPPWDEPPAPCRFNTLLRDEAMIAVDKPAGLPVLPGAGFVHSTLLHLVRREEPQASPLHRLGRWTSGIVLFARTRAARVALCAQWAGRSVVKRYRGLAAGRIAPDVLAINRRIGPVPHDRLGTVHAASDAGRDALTSLRVLERRADASLCELRIVTGRPHQIRIHLAAIGHPLVGDPLYPAGGVPDAACTVLPGAPGYRLHACELRVRHPLSGAATTISCDPSDPLLVPRVRP